MRPRLALWQMHKWAGFHLENWSSVPLRTYWSPYGIGTNHEKGKFCSIKCADSLIPLQHPWNWEFLGWGWCATVWRSPFINPLSWTILDLTLKWSHLNQRQCGVGQSRQIRERNLNLFLCCGNLELFSKMSRGCQLILKRSPHFYESGIPGVLGQKVQDPLCILGTAHQRIKTSQHRV